MRNKLLLLFVLLLTVGIVVACGNNDETMIDEETETTDETEAFAYEPEAIADTDICDICAMAVSDNQHAAQIVLTNERSLKFDDIGCLHAWIDENGEDDIGTAFVRDYHTEQWIDIENASF